MLMQSVTLCDQMTMERSAALSSILRAQGGARSFRRTRQPRAEGGGGAAETATSCTRGARITRKKYIPVAAGMGGGSSDAAAALVGLNRLWGLGLSPDKLEEIGLTVGADVPFCIRGGLQRAKGVGEKLTPLAMKKPLYLVAFNHAAAVHQEVFTALHEDGIRTRTGRITRRRSVRRPRRCSRARRGAGECRTGFERMRRKLTAPFAPLRKRRGWRANDGSETGFRRVHARGRMPPGDGSARRLIHCRMMRTAAHGIVIEEEA
ncbi:MAG: 4-(cytidine 5'-diphospho)-2-C-methyl-D-erythritol kinase [Christensenellales bacterium]